MNFILVKIWKLIKGPLQWYVLWFFHHKFIVGVSGVIFNDQNKVLLLQHKYWKKDSWGLPSGYLVKSEDLENGLKREIMEETNYQTEIISLIRIKSGFKLRLEVSFFGKFIGGEKKLDTKEVISAEFFSTDNLPFGLLESHKELVSLAIKKKMEVENEKDNKFV